MGGSEPALWWSDLELGLPGLGSCGADLHVDCETEKLWGAMEEPHAVFLGVRGGCCPPTPRPGKVGVWSLGREVQAGGGSCWARSAVNTLAEWGYGREAHRERRKAGEGAQRLGSLESIFGGHWGSPEERRSGPGGKVWVGSLALRAWECPQTLTMSWSLVPTGQFVLGGGRVSNETRSVRCRDQKDGTPLSLLKIYLWSQCTSHRHRENIQ